MSCTSGGHPEAAPEKALSKHRLRCRIPYRPDLDIRILATVDGDVAAVGSMHIADGATRACLHSHHGLKSGCELQEGGTMRDRRTVTTEIDAAAITGVAQAREVDD